MTPHHLLENLQNFNRKQQPSLITTRTITLISCGVLLMFSFSCVLQGIPTLLMAAGSFDDILAITGFSTCLGIAFSTGLCRTLYSAPCHQVLHAVCCRFHVDEHPEGSARGVGRRRSRAAPGPVPVVVPQCGPGEPGGILAPPLVWTGFLRPVTVRLSLQEDLVLRRTLLLLGLSVFAVFFSHVVGFAGAGGLCTLVLAFLAALGWKADKVTASIRSGSESWILLSTHSTTDSLCLPQAPVAAMVGRSWDVFQPLLFGLIGAEITIAKLNPNTVGKDPGPKLDLVPVRSQLGNWCSLCSGLGLACLGAGLVVRLLATFLLVHFGGFSLKEKLFISVAWLPKATVQVPADPCKTASGRPEPSGTSVNQNLYKTSGDPWSEGEELLEGVTS